MTKIAHHFALIILMRYNVLFEIQPRGHKISQIDF